MRLGRSQYVLVEQNEVVNVYIEGFVWVCFEVVVCLGQGPVLLKEQPHNNDHRRKTSRVPVNDIVNDVRYEGLLAPLQRVGMVLSKDFNKLNSALHETEDGEHYNSQL